jgi:cytidylate kinase
MLVHINSYPGVGKLTIGRALMEMIGAKLLDNHSIYNVAFALTEFKSAAYYETIRAVRAIAYQRVLELPASMRSIPRGGTSAGMTLSHWPSGGARRSTM